MKYLPGLLLLFFPFFSLSQERSELSSVRCTSGDQPVGGLQVLLVNGQADTLRSERTSKEGIAVLNEPLDPEVTYTLILRQKGIKDHIVRIDTENYRNLDQRLVLEIGLPVYTQPFGPGFIVYFDASEKEPFAEMDMTWLHQLFDQFPHNCVQFMQTVDADEPIRTSQKRMKSFETQLKAAGIPMDHVQFSANIQHLIAGDAETQPHFEGIIVSNDGPCKP